MIDQDMRDGNLLHCDACGYNEIVSAETVDPPACPRCGSTTRVSLHRPAVHWPNGRRHKERT